LTRKKKSPTLSLKKRGRIVKEKGERSSLSRNLTVWKQTNPMCFPQKKKRRPNSKKKEKKKKNQNGKKRTYFCDWGGGEINN